MERSQETKGLGVGRGKDSCSGGQMLWVVVESRSILLALQEKDLVTEAIVTGSEASRF